MMKFIMMYMMMHMMVYTYLWTIQIVSILASPHHYRYHVPPAQGVEELLRDVVLAVAVLKCEVKLVLLITRNISIR